MGLDTVMKSVTIQKNPAMLFITFRLIKFTA